MRFIPVLHPFFPLSGVLALHTVIVYALAKDAKACSRPYLNGLCMMELTLLSVAMATIAPSRGMIQFWNMLLTVTRTALCPCWVWMALDTSGMKPLGLSSRRAYALAMAPVAAFAALIFLNPVLRWYWPDVGFDGRVMVVSRSALPLLSIAYCQLLLALGSLAYAAGVARHRGRERARLVVLALAYGLLFLGDWLWQLGVPLYRGVNPLSFFLTLGFYAVAASLFLYGFPRMRGPITDADIRALPPLELSRDRPEPALSPALSARQETIVLMVMDGLPYKAIASELGIAERTVKYHMGQILDKVGLETREQLIAWAALKVGAGR